MKARQLTQQVEMYGPGGEPYQVVVHMQVFDDDDSVKYWHSAQAADGQIVEPWRDGEFQKGDGTILVCRMLPPFSRRLPVDPLPSS